MTIKSFWSNFFQKVCGVQGQRPCLCFKGKRPLTQNNYELRITISVYSKTDFILILEKIRIKL